MTGVADEVEAWLESRDRIAAMRSDVVDALRVIDNGRPLPDCYRQRPGRRAAWRMIRDTDQE